MTDEDRYLNERDVAAMLSVSPKFLKHLRLQGGGPRFSKLGTKIVRYRAADVLAWASGRSYGSTSELAVA